VPARYDWGRTCWSSSSSLRWSFSDFGRLTVVSMKAFSKLRRSLGLLPTLPIEARGTGPDGQVPVNLPGAPGSEQRDGRCTLSVVVPTRSEAPNVAILVSRLRVALRSSGLDWELVFIDDSDDGTPDAIRQTMLADPAVRLVHRARGARRGGLGGAVSAGFQVARGEVIAVIDADLQHPPEVLGAVITPVLSGKAELVAGNRYAWAGGTSGLAGWWRHLVSWACRVLVHALVPSSRKLMDPLGGLFAVRRSVLEGVALQPCGYKILLEVIVRCQPRSVGNVGFDFAPRQAGKSKADLREGLLFLRHLRRLAAADRCDVVTPSPTMLVPAGPSPGGI
jgi:dolichol-phosphate mannosyltransferase